MTSKIKVDNINKVSDDSNIIKKCGTTTTIGSGASNPIVVDGSAVTLGRCGGTVALASGATQTGFGRTGTVDWDTTPKTATFTAANGEGYFVNTTGGAITVNLPAGSAGSIVAVSDYASTANSNNITVSPNGSDKINGINAVYTISTQGLAVTLVFVDSVRGWKSVTGSDANATGQVPATFTSASVSGACNSIITSGDYKIAKFVGPGTFTVSTVGNAPASPGGGPNQVDYLVVAAGGGGAPYGLGGGGAGGFRLGAATGSSTTPLSAPGLTLTATAFPITIGGGGAGTGSSPCGGTKGTPSIFSTITSAGGGGAGNSPPSNPSDFTAGGSGGAIGRDAYLAGRNTACNGNVPPVSPPQGNMGGVHVYPANTSGSRGGGGAGSASSNGGPVVPGGDAAPVTAIFGASPQPWYTGSPANGSFAGGGGGAEFQGPSGAGGGSVAGGGGTLPGPGGGGAGQTNTGGGGGGGGPGGGVIGGAGGSGIVLIRYKFQ
jgi:hypothetical protein